MNPFTVPDGYFEKLADEVMAKLPERKAVIIDIKPHRHLARRIYIACCAAAVCCGIFFSVRFLMNNRFEDSSNTALSAEQVYHEKYVDDALDYSMIDNHEIYEYLSDAN
jgi:hypothetical protein